MQVEAHTTPAKGAQDTLIPSFLFSSIRTLTVGSGISPDLLDPFSMNEKGARGLMPKGNYRRWGISPRPENVTG